MANEQNLKPIQKGELSNEEAKKRGSKGGIASGKARREKATMKKTLEMMLDVENSKGNTYKELATLGLIKGAVKGNAHNYRTIVEVLGEINGQQEKGTPDININIIDNNSLEKALYEEEED